MTAVAPLLSLRSVDVRYWRGQRPVDVLKDVSLELEEGEFGGVWGDRGSGKTTLAKVAAGIVKPDSGTVSLGGQELTDVARQHRHGALHWQIGVATRQGPQAEELPVAWWVASMLAASCSWREARRRANVALDRVGVSAVADEPWANLSDGERMLVSIAHAIVCAPKVLVVDDPVAGLGAMQRAEVMDLLHEIAALGVAVLVTAAELIELQGANRIWSLSDGHLTGPPARRLGTVVPLRGASESASRLSR